MILCIYFRGSYTCGSIAHPNSLQKGSQMQKESSRQRLREERSVLERFGTGKKTFFSVGHILHKTKRISVNQEVILCATMGVVTGRYFIALGTGITRFEPRASSLQKEHFVRIIDGTRLNFVLSRTKNDLLNIGEPARMQGTAIPILEVVENYRRRWVVICGTFA